MNKANTRKLLFDGGRNDTFNSGKFKLIKKNFFRGVSEKIFGCWVRCSPPIFRVSQKGLGEWGTVLTWWGQQSSIEGGDTLGKKGNTWAIILGDNPSGYCFVLTKLGPASFFNSSHKT